ncbi:MAG: glycoside hydrolase, partial [Prevotella sp.]|nr:glycoside hydrolase [Prevotella sp.]
GEPVTSYKIPNVGRTDPIETPVDSDEFDSPKLGLQWSWHANPKQTWGYASNMGYYRMYGQYYPEDFTNFWDIPNLLMQKLTAPEFTATMKVTAVLQNEGDKAGLIIMGWDYSYLALKKTANGYALEQVVCLDAEQKTQEKVITDIALKNLKIEEKLNYQTPTNNVHFYMQMKVQDGGICTFAYSTDGKKYENIGKPFQAKQGKWIGAKTGMFIMNKTPNTTRSWIDVDWFRVEK